MVVVATKVYETICPRMYMAFSVESQTEKMKFSKRSCVMLMKRNKYEDRYILYQ